MFDVGFTELLLVALVALLVLGPERLPGAARTAGLWIGRLKRSFAAIKSEVEREIGADQIRLQLHNEQILERERQQQAAPAAAAAPPAGADTPSSGPTAEQANAPIAANSRLNALPEYQSRAQADAEAPQPAAEPAGPVPAQSAGQPAAPSEPPRPT
ncbi:Sec-independent protein translocase protein TatB [Pseudomonas stutzeri]|nr:Sec-independent protein translocase protein TatB [Stutzerimonas stutzeri]